MKASVSNHRTVRPTGVRAKTKKWTRFAGWLIPGLALSLLWAGSRRASAQPFVHPGGLHNQADLDRMKEKVAAGAHPWIDDWNLLITDPLAQDIYRAAPSANMASRQRASADAHAAYLNTIRWYISGDTRYADCAIRICNAWSGTVNQVVSGNDTPGLSGIPIGEFALVGELLRVSPRWAPEDFARYKNMLVTYMYPVCHDFLTKHNGSSTTRYWANWDIGNIGACIAIGVLADNRAIFDEGVNYYKSGVGTGGIMNAVYFMHPGNLGQWQESGRDQEHAQLGVGMMAQLCEVAWKQGLDLYGFADNRLLSGAEYVAQWNLWKPVPYKYYTNSDDANQSWASINGRGRLDRPVWELLYNHYVVRKGLSAPNTTAMAKVMRPERGNGDHFGYGSLTFTLDGTKSAYPPSPIPPVPTKLTATAGVDRVYLQWMGSGDTAQGYVLRRSTTQGGPYTDIMSWSNSSRCEETDKEVAPGTTYYYVVAAQNQPGISNESAPASATPLRSGELPEGWVQTSIGIVNGATAGFADVSGGSFKLSGSGTGIGGRSDGVCYLNRSVTGDITFTARLSDADWKGGGAQKIGIMMRDSLAADSPTLVMKLGDIGNRRAEFGTRSAVGAPMKWVRGNDYTWIPAWFRLQRTGDNFTAFQSSDGVEWFRVGTSTVPLGKNFLIGFAVSSNNDNPDTALFDHVSLTGTGLPVAAAAGPVKN